MSARREAHRRLPATVLVAVLAAAHPEAFAEGTWSGSIAATSDYVFRGVSQTYGGAALQGSLSYRGAAGWFAGAWASNVDPYPLDIGSTEVNAFVGFGRAIAQDWSAHATYTRYLYAWDRRRAPYDYGEFAVALAFQDRLEATLSYQPDATRYTSLGYARHRSATAVEMSGRWPLPHGFALTGSAGYYDLTRLYDVGYWAGSAGMSYARGPLEVDAARFFGDRTLRRLYEDASADGRWVVSAIWRF